MEKRNRRRNEQREGAVLDHEVYVLPMSSNCTAFSVFSKATASGCSRNLFTAAL